MNTIRKNLKAGGGPSGDKSRKNILWLEELSNDDVKLVGGKNASLGEMYVNLRKLGVNVPDGFTVTAKAYREFIESTGLKEEIKNTLKGLNTSNLSDLRKKGKKVRNLILDAEFPQSLKNYIAEAYSKLEEKYGKHVDVAVRSSATAEDLPDASFAGQQETYLNISSSKQLLEACKKCFASLFTNRAISYRVDKGFNHFDVALSIGVQKMVRSDLAGSGVMFSIDTESGFENVVFVTAAYGLGENVVQGAVNPDEYFVFKPTLEEGYKPLIKKRVGEKHIKMIYDSHGTKGTKNVTVPPHKRDEYVLTEEEVLELSKWATIIEDHYSHKKGKYQPMDMEWAKDGKSGELFIVQARPETVVSNRDKNTIANYKLEEKGEELVKGVSIGDKIANGTSKVIKDINEAGKFNKGDVLITDMTDPDWEPIMKKASAIVTNRGGRTCFSSDTKLLTNEGFKTFEEIYERGTEGLKVPSMRRDTLKIEWKEVTDVMRRKDNLIKINSSQTGKNVDNTLKLTPNHKMLNIRNSELVDTKIKDILENNDSLLLAQHIPQLHSSTRKEQSLAYLLGGIMTDGHIHTRRTHGEVTFIQKDIPEKAAFIEQMQKSMQVSYNKKFTVSKKATSKGIIRGQTVTGNANAYRCYSKEIAYDLQEQTNTIVQNILVSDTSLAYTFLGGVIDGDGSYKNGRINLYISKKELLESVIVACLRIGTVPQVTRNRNISNVQIVEKLNEINKYTYRVDCKDTRNVGSRFFSAKQLFNDNFSSDINNRVRNNLLIDENNLNKLLPELSEETKNKVETLLKSDTRQARVNKIEDIGEDYVYNITVEDNHNYIVFSDKYSPILVNNCHAAIIAREMGVPAVVGCGNATEELKSGNKVTVSCVESEAGKVYKGTLKYRKENINIKKIPETDTKIMMNIGNPYLAFSQSFLPNDGVGLAREEFIINSDVKIHPNALLDYDTLKRKRDSETKEVVKQIKEITKGYESKVQYYIDKLAEGIGMIGSAFYPKKVIIRLSDFKSNEYANLIGGHFYEPKEDNPMIGFRGASRYYSDNFKEAFKLELKAIKKAREQFGLKNIALMIPFCRTTEEARKVLQVMKEAGLERGKDSLKVYLMCEIPSNVILADEFLQKVDGYSIGSNDLTQLALGVDRDSELVSQVYDERNNAVKTLLKDVIKKCKEKRKYIGICGQAPSDYPDFAEFLVEQGIESLSLNPDTIIKTKLKIAKKEEKLNKERQEKKTHNKK